MKHLVNSYLNRSWSIEGNVITGKKLGRKIGFPTCNIDIDNYVIANRELREKKLPFIIQRPMANGKSEYWNINDLEFLE